MTAQVKNKELKLKAKDESEARTLELLYKLLECVDTNHFSMISLSEDLTEFRIIF